jgi:DNA-directed RNA polymerase subunit RPC12/RpoP
MDTAVVRCGECGRKLDEPSSLPVEQRDPCPSCGSKSRQFEVHLTAVVRVAATIGREVRRSYYERSLPSLIVLALLTVSSGLIGGLILSGWSSVGVSITFSVASFFVGLRAVTKVRKVEKSDQ